jgi:predicted RNase H-like nuclease (RuvC/YqgF family)
MTQKEYKEKIEKYEKQIFDLQTELDGERSKNFNYLEVLERNYQLQKELEHERSKNDIACRNIDELNDIIDKYKKIIDKFTINF